MDKDRQVRFLYPPLVFIGFCLWALYLDPNRSITQYFPQIQQDASLNAGTLIGLVAGGGVVVLVAGFLISAISIFLLRMAFKVSGHHTYEAVWSPETRKRLSTIIGLSKSVKDDQVLYLAAVFDHVLLPEGIHAWLFRRWSTFNLSMSSCVALIFALVGRVWSGLSPGVGWHVVWAFCLVALATHGSFAWCETMGLAEFYSNLDRSMFKFPNKPSQKITNGMDTSS
jgi:hypothetical protein